jgi:lauroyl/myristoyl acyltransferase
MPIELDYQEGSACNRHEAANAARLSAWIAAHIRELPAQCVQGHRRFKTRPEGERSIYD